MLKAHLGPTVSVMVVALAHPPGKVTHAARACALRRRLPERGHARAAGIATHDFCRARRHHHCRPQLERRRLMAWRGCGDARGRHGGRDLLAIRADLGPRRRQRQSRCELACEAFGAARHFAGGRSPAARRQRRLPARRLRLSAPPSGARHPLSPRGRHPHRRPRPLDVVRTGRRLVRDRARRSVRAGRRIVPAASFA